MTVPFLSGATGDPINLQRQVIGQPDRSVPINIPESGVTGWRDFRSNGGPVIFEPGEIERQVIAAGGQPQGNLVGKINLPEIPFAIGDVDPANFGLMHFLNNLFEGHTYTDLTTYNRYDFSLIGATPAAGFLSYREWNDVLPGFRLTDLIISALNIVTSPNENLSVNFTGLASEFDFHGAVSQTVGAASDLPVFKRYWGSYPNIGNFAADATDQDIFLRVDDSIDPIDVSIKVATASAYANAQLNEALGNFWRCYDENGDMLGTIAEQILYRFPAAATLVDLDEFQVLKRMVKWSPSLGDDQPISSVNTIFYLDGVEWRTEGGWQVAGQRENSEFRPDVSGRQGGTVRKSGDLDFTITPTSEVVDLTLQEAILNASIVSCVIEAKTDVLIPGATVPFRYLQVYPQCRVFGSTFGVEPGGQNRDQSARLVPEEPDTPLVYDGQSFAAHAHHVLENDIAAI